jgi:AraC-like DNA-binding protein
MDREKPYLRQDFSIEELAEMLGVPRHHLYYCFNNVLKKKFVVLRMEYRIMEVKKCLLEADLETTTLEAIGGSCGFASRSAFYRIFTEQVGCSPGEFIEQHKRPE